MDNVCARCGEFHVEKTILANGPVAVCPACGHQHPFLQLPLFCVGGASGSGKTTICRQLMGQCQDAIVLDGDLLWQTEFDTPDDNYREFFETWLRLSKNIAQSGKPVAIFNAGAIPVNVEPCLERRYFSKIHYLALVCDNAILTKRLQQRPQWRNSHHEAFIETQSNFNQWFKEQGKLASPPITLLNTSVDTVEQTAAKVADWIRQSSPVAISG